VYVELLALLRRHETGNATHVCFFKVSASPQTNIVDAFFFETLSIPLFVLRCYTAFHYDFMSIFLHESTTIMIFNETIQMCFKFLLSLISVA
jgi:hypothetical protein